MSNGQCLRKETRGEWRYHAAVRHQSKWRACYLDRWLGPLVPTIYPYPSVRSSRNPSQIHDGPHPCFPSPLWSQFLNIKTKGRGNLGGKRKEKQDAQRAEVFAFYPDVAQVPRKGSDGKHSICLLSKPEATRMSNVTLVKKWQVGRSPTGVSWAVAPAVLPFPAITHTVPSAESPSSSQTVILLPFSDSAQTCYRSGKLPHHPQDGSTATPPHHQYPVSSSGFYHSTGL